jgi:hypothetical protein
MPTPSKASPPKSRGGVLSRGVAPFAPLAIALVAQTALLGGGGGGRSETERTADAAVVCDEDIPSFQECHSEYPTGCSKAGKYDGYLNFLKNQLVDPARRPLRVLNGDDIGKLEEGLPADLSKSNHEELKKDLAVLGEGHVVTVLGYLYYAKKGGGESSNCLLTDPTDIDYHIGIGFEPGLAEKLAGKTKLTVAERQEMNQSSMVIEMTPHWRAVFRPTLTLAAFAPAIGRQVRVVGQLVADSEHYTPKDDCGLAGASAACWRATVWELHPVTRFEVCGTPEPCTDAGKGWMDLEELSGAQPPAASPPA